LAVAGVRRNFSQAAPKHIRGGPIEPAAEGMSGSRLAAARSWCAAIAACCTPPRARGRSHEGPPLVIVERRYFTGRGGTTLLSHALLTDTSSLYPFEGDAHAVELESLMASGQRDSRSSSSAG